MRRDTLLGVIGVALLLCGCPKRQTSSRVVYVAAPPAVATNTPAKTGGEMVIEEPPPPEPPEPQAETTPQEPTTQKNPARPRRRVTTPTETPVETQPTPETAEPPPVTAPALEPRESPQQQSVLRLRVLQSQESVQARIGSLEHTPMASVDRKTLEDARMFLNQSRKALEGSDLQRAFNLARKASLLVDALEQKP